MTQKWRVVAIAGAVVAGGAVLLSTSGWFDSDTTQETGPQIAIESSVQVCARGADACATLPAAYATYKVMLGGTEVSTGTLSRAGTASIAVSAERDYTVTIQATDLGVEASSPPVRVSTAQASTSIQVDLPALTIISTP